MALSETLTLQQVDTRIYQFPKKQTILGVDTTDFGPQVSNPKWALDEPQAKTLRGNTRNRHVWLSECWQQARPLLESGSSIQEVIEKAGVTDPSLRTSIRKSFALRTTFAEARQISTGVRDSQPDGWQMLYSERAHQLGLILNPDRPGRKEQKLALSIVREKRLAMQQVLNILPDEPDRDPLLVSHLIKQIAQEKLRELRESLLKRVVNPPREHRIVFKYRDPYLEAKRTLDITVASVTLTASVIIGYLVTNTIYTEESKPVHASWGALLHSLLEILRGI